MTNKRGGDSAFPNTYDADRFRGLTYRQYLAAQIAGHVVTRSGFLQALADRVDDENAVRLVGKTVWMWTDAILEAETAPPEQHEA